MHYFVSLVLGFCITLNFSNQLTAINLEFYWNDWATHQPVLYEIAKHTDGPIIEFGCGNGSTPLLHAICKATNRLLISIDDDEVWVKQFAQKYINDGYEEDNSGWHKFFFVPGRTENTRDIDYWISFLDNFDLLKTTSFDLCFVDQHPGLARSETIRRLKDNVKFIILHDCDCYVSGQQELGHQLAPIDGANNIPGIYDFSPSFKFSKVYFPAKPWPAQSGPPTLLGSNFEDYIPEIDYATYPRQIED